MKLDKNFSLEDVARFVMSQLKKHEVDCVLVGGAVVSILTNNRYQSYDLDIVCGVEYDELDIIMSEIGFERKKTRYYESNDTDFYIDFLNTPVAVGGKVLKGFTEETECGKYLKMLTPTQSIMDRLAHYYHWKDFQALEQAVWIAEDHMEELDFIEIRNWSEQEGYLNKYKEFIKRLNRHKNS